MRPADIPTVARIEGAAFGREAWPRAAFTYVAEVFAVARPARGHFWVAEGRDRIVVGYAGIELSALGSEADIVNIAVDPAHRRRGMGRRLLLAVLGFCRAHRVPLVWLRVRASNRGARTFYRRCGFRTVGRFRAYYDRPHEDAILMAHTGHP